MTRNRKRKQDLRKFMELNDVSYLQARRENENSSSVRISTGLPTVDHYTQGLIPGQVTAIASRPGVGKTILSITLLLNALKSNKNALVFSLEMSRKEILHRLGSAAGIRSMNDANFADLHEESFGGGKVTVDDNSQTPETMRELALKISKAEKLDLIVIDSFELLERNPDERFNEALGRIRAVRALALELNVPIVVVSSLNRDHKEGEAQLSELKGSLSLAAESDVVILLHRVAGFDNGVNVILSKNRNGVSAVEVGCMLIPERQLIVEV